MKAGMNPAARWEKTRGTLPALDSGVFALGHGRAGLGGLKIAPVDW